MESRTSGLTIPEEQERALSDVELEARIAKAQAWNEKIDIDAQKHAIDPDLKAVIPHLRRYFGEHKSIAEGELSRRVKRKQQDKLKAQRQTVEEKISYLKTNAHEGFPDQIRELQALMECIPEAIESLEMEIFRIDVAVRKSWNWILKNRDFTNPALDRVGMKETDNLRPPSGPLGFGGCGWGYLPGTKQDIEQTIAETAAMLGRPTPATQQSDLKKPPKVDSSTASEDAGIRNLFSEYQECHTAGQHPDSQRPATAGDKGGNLPGPPSGTPEKREGHLGRWPMATQDINNDCSATGEAAAIPSWLYRPAQVPLASKLDIRTAAKWLGDFEKLSSTKSLNPDQREDLKIALQVARYAVKYAPQRAEIERLREDLRCLNNASRLAERNISEGVAWQEGDSLVRPEKVLPLIKKEVSARQKELVSAVLALPRFCSPSGPVISAAEKALQKFGVSSDSALYRWLRMPFDGPCSDIDLDTLLSESIPVEEFLEVVGVDIRADEPVLAALTDESAAIDKRGSSEASVDVQPLEPPSDETAEENTDAKFNRIAGALWRAVARKRKCVPDDDLKSIVASLEKAGFSNLHQILEPSGRKKLADYNQKNNRDPIKTLGDLPAKVFGKSSASAKEIRRAFVRRLSRAAGRS